MNQPETDEHNKRTVQAIILCVIVAMFYTQLVVKPPVAPQTQVATVQGGAVPQAVSTPIVPVAAVKHPSIEEFNQSSTTIVDNGTVRTELTSLGARIKSFKLLDYKLHVGEDAALDMVDSPSGAVLPLAVYVGNESDDFVRYKLESISATPQADGSYQTSAAKDLSLVYRGQLPSGKEIIKTIKFSHGSYLFSVDVAFAETQTEPVWLEWAHHFPKNQQNPRLNITHLTYLDAESKVKQVTLDQLQTPAAEYGKNEWLSLSDLYFMATIIPSGISEGTILGREDEVLFGRVRSAASSTHFNVYVGPKDYKTLQNYNFKLERAIDLGWFAFIALPLLWAVHYLYLVLGNYGLAIIALTLIVRSLLLPLSKASFQSAAKMQELQPEIKALRERVKDPQQMNKEVFELYRRKGVNPMGGCLPMLIQIPVFFGLYNALLNSIELRHAPFALWIKDLSVPEYLDLAGFGVPVLVLLMAATMIWQQRTMPQPADPAQAQAMKIVPYVVAGTFVFFPMPAGLVLYWLVSNIISITQQTYLRNAEKGSVYAATIVIGAITFAVGYIVTLL